MNHGFRPRRPQPSEDLRQTHRGGPRVVPGRARRGGGAVGAKRGRQNHERLRGGGVGSSRRRQSHLGGRRLDPRPHARPRPKGRRVFAPRAQRLPQAQRGRQHRGHP